MEVTDGKHAGQSQKAFGRLSTEAEALPECEMKILMTSDHIVFYVSSSGYGRAIIGRSSWEGLYTGLHEETPVHCPWSRLAELHGALWMRSWPMFVLLYVFNKPLEIVPFYKVLHNKVMTKKIIIF